MKFKYHILIGFIVSYILVQFFNFSLLSGTIIFLTSWLIDIDHYFWYGLSRKDWNPLHAIDWYKKFVLKWPKLSLRERNKFKRGSFIFHGIEFWIILILLSFVHEFFLWVLVGVVIHMIADWIDLMLRNESLYDKMSLIYIIRRNKKKKGLEEL